MTKSSLQITEVPESKYLDLLQQTENFTFYNSEARFSFLRNRGRNLFFFAIEEDGVPTGLIHYQLIPAQSGKMIYFQHTPLPIKTISSEQVIQTFDHLKSFIKERLSFHKASFARLTPRIKKDPETLKAIYKLGYNRAPTQEIDSCVTHIIDINNFDIMKIRKTSRHCVTQGIKAGIKTTVETESINFSTFLSFYTEMEKTKGFTPLPSDYIIQELEEYQEAEMLRQYVTSFEGEVLTIAQVIIFRNRAYYYHAATSQKGKRMNASHVNLYHIIEDLKDKKNIEILDLWGGAISKIIKERKIKHPWESLDLFKRGFSSQLIEFLPPIDLPRNILSYAAPYVYQRYLALKRGYPIID